MGRMKSPLAMLVWLAVLHAYPAAAQGSGQSFQAGVHLATATSGEFDNADIGAGGRLSWHPVPLLALEGEVTLYPGDFPDTVAFSASRLEGLFGATVGPRLGRIRPFAKLRPGFVTFRAAPEPLACILIFPPPLACTLASGRTVFALDAGGGVEWFLADRAVVRVDVGDRLVRYPSPVIDSGGEVREGSFSSHDVRFTLGAGIRF